MSGSGGNKFAKVGGGAAGYPSGGMGSGRQPTANGESG